MDRKYDVFFKMFKKKYSATNLNNQTEPCKSSILSGFVLLSVWAVA